MNKLTIFFWHCSGADLELLKKCPTEQSRYVGIGATIFFTGLFAALSGGYALYTVFDNVWIAVAMGFLWGLMIFNLDRYIVSSMRKEGRPAREWLMALPRIMLALIISIVIAKPLELKIFDKEIAPELIVMEQQAFARQERELKLRFQPRQDSLAASLESLKQELTTKAQQRDALRALAQQEADGTGGSRKKNLGPIYQVKKADADRADAELQALTARQLPRIQQLERELVREDSLLTAGLAALERHTRNGPAARIEALQHLTDASPAIWWANFFIMLLFIAIETAPVLVKLITKKGPYDNLLRMAEHGFDVQEAEHLAATNADAKARHTAMSQHERDYLRDRLDQALK